MFSFPGHIPRISLSNLNTPIEKCERLSAYFDNGPEIFIKRDDFIGSLVWGNKLRKLEFSLADAIEQGAQTIITCGGVQSNHCRITAQVCKRLGLHCVLVQNGDPQENPSGNHKINRLMGIPIHYVKTGGERDSKMKEVFESLNQRRLNPYIVPLGASNAIGCMGFANALMELKEQQEMLGIEFDAIIHSTSSGGTQAGMIIGKKLFGFDKLELIGISSDTSVEDLKASILSCTGPALQKLGSDVKIREEELIIDTGYLGPGYGIPSEKSDEAKKIFMDYEGIMLDTTYTAKAAAGLIDYIRQGKFKSSQKVLFWHTGGILAEL